MFFLTFSASESVFYNPVQEFNRDLTIAIISAFSRHCAKEEAKEVETASLGKTRRRKIRVQYAQRDTSVGPKDRLATS